MERTIERLRAEFLEMPGLRLTAVQIQRLCGVDELVCRAALAALIDARFLCMKPDGTYARLTDGAIGRLRPARARLMPRRTRSAS